MDKKEELDAIRKDFLALVDNEDLQENPELKKKMYKMTINNFFDFLKGKI